MDERDIPNSWHINLLRRFYPWRVSFQRYVPFIFEYSIKFLFQCFAILLSSCFFLSDSVYAYNILKMTHQLCLWQMPEQTHWCSDASRDDPVFDFSLHVHERPPSASWVVGSGSLAMPYSFHTYTAPVPRVTVNMLAWAGDSAIHFWLDGLYQI